MLAFIFRPWHIRSIFKVQSRKFFNQAPLLACGVSMQPPAMNKIISHCCGFASRKICILSHYGPPGGFTILLEKYCFSSSLWKMPWSMFKIFILFFHKVLHSKDSLFNFVGIFFMTLLHFSFLCVVMHVLFYLTCSYYSQWNVKKIHYKKFSWIKMLIHVVKIACIILL